MLKNPKFKLGDKVSLHNGSEKGEIIAIDFQESYPYFVHWYESVFDYDEKLCWEWNTGKSFQLIPENSN